MAPQAAAAAGIPLIQRRRPPPQAAAAAGVSLVQVAPHPKQMHQRVNGPGQHVLHHVSQCMRAAQRYMQLHQLARANPPSMPLRPQLHQLARANPPSMPLRPQMQRRLQQARRTWMRPPHHRHHRRRRRHHRRHHRRRYLRRHRRHHRRRHPPYDAQRHRRQRHPYRGRCRRRRCSSSRRLETHGEEQQRQVTEGIERKPLYQLAASHLNPNAHARYTS